MLGFVRYVGSLLGRSRTRGLDCHKQTFAGQKSNAGSQAHVDVHTAEPQKMTACLSIDLESETQLRSEFQRGGSTKQAHTCPPADTHTQTKWHEEWRSSFAPDRRLFKVLKRTVLTGWHKQASHSRTSRALGAASPEDLGVPVLERDKPEGPVCGAGAGAGVRQGATEARGAEAKQPGTRDACGRCFDASEGRKAPRLLATLSGTGTLLCPAREAAACEGGLCCTESGDVPAAGKGPSGTAAAEPKAGRSR